MLSQNRNNLPLLQQRDQRDRISFALSTGGRESSRGPSHVTSSQYGVGTHANRTCSRSVDARIEGWRTKWPCKDVQTFRVSIDSFRRRKCYVSYYHLACAFQTKGNDKESKIILYQFFKVMTVWIFFSYHFLFTLYLHFFYLFLYQKA